MKRSFTSIGLPLLIVIACSLALVLSPRASNPAGSPGDKAGPVQVDNTRDPICGMKVDKVPAANTVQYNGKLIGFCSSHCRAAWDKLTPGEKDKKMAASMANQMASSGKEEYPVLSKPGSKIALDRDHYFTYGFPESPKMGQSVMKVEIFSLDGKRDTTFRVTGDADMPSMRGAHAMGNKDFSKSAKGFFLLPVQLVMPGDWEIRLVFEKDGHTVLRGAYLFNL